MLISMVMVEMVESVSLNKSVLCQLLYDLNRCADPKTKRKSNVPKSFPIRVTQLNRAYLH